jgi:hypothetical protein
LDYQVGQWLSIPDVKASLEKVYQELKIDKKAKGSDLLSFYNIKKHNKMKAGKTMTGYKIISAKIK